MSAFVCSGEGREGDIELCITCWSEWLNFGFDQGGREEGDELCEVGSLSRGGGGERELVFVDSERGEISWYDRGVDGDG